MSNRGLRISPAPYCPECGAVMVLRRPRPNQNWDPFWGCSSYPDCRGVRHIRPDGSPEDDDDWLEELI